MFATLSFLCAVTELLGSGLADICAPLEGSQGSDTIVPVCMEFPTRASMHESIYLRDNHYKTVWLGLLCVA